MPDVETALPTAFRVGEAAATEAEFEEWVRRYQRRVYRYLLMLVRDPEEADNLTQESFLKAYRALSTFRGECSVETWLLRIATNLARDRARDRKAGFWKRLLGLDDEEESPQVAAHVSRLPSPEKLLLHREAVEAVWKAVETLSQQQRAVFVLRFVEELELREIAEVMGLRVGSVKAHLFRALQTVRGQLKELS